MPETKYFYVNNDAEEQEVYKSYHLELLIDVTRNGEPVGVEFVDYAPAALETFEEIFGRLDDRVRASGWENKIVININADNEQ